MAEALNLALCDMQGQLFEMSIEKGFDSGKFVREFMNSAIAAALDSEFNHMQWAGKEYIMNRIEDELKCKLEKTKLCFDKETMYWMGYLYRYWHYYTGENSRQIYKQAPASKMQVTFFAYHTLSTELAIDKLRVSHI